MNSSGELTIGLNMELNNITNSINFYYSAIVIPIGIVLNLVTIFIFARSSRVTKKNIIISILYIGLSIYDILALLNSILFAQLLPSMGVYIVNYSVANCIALNWWRKVIVQAPSWVQVIITFERYFSVKYANGVRIFTKKLNVVMILISILIFLIFFNMGHAWYYTTRVSHETTIYIDNDADEKTFQIVSNESIVCTSSNAVSLVTDIVNVLFRFLIPFALMIVLNIFISKSLYESRKKTAVKNRSLKQERNYTLTVIGFNVLFFVLNLPWAVYYVLSHIHISGLVVFNSSLDNAILGLMNSIVFSIFYLNNFSSFFLNLFFNRLFRKQFFSLTRKSWKVSHMPSSNQNNTINTQ